MIDQHLLAGGQVELGGDQLLDEVPGKAASPGNGARVGNAPAFVGVAILGGRADREGRHLVEEEIQSVIVVDDDRDVGLDGLEPGAHRAIGLEERRQ